MLPDIHLQDVLLQSGFLEQGLIGLSLLPLCPANDKDAATVGGGPALPAPGLADVRATFGVVRRGDHGDEDTIIMAVS